MQITIQSLRVFALGFFVAAFFLGTFSPEAFAQSGTKGFGSTAASNFVNRNSASRFSTQRLTGDLRNQSVRAVGVPGVNQKNFLSNSSSPLGRKSKPFAGFSRGPSVSPYLALSAPRASAVDFQTIIRPQQQQNRANRRQQHQAAQQHRRLNQMAAKAPFSTTGDANRAPTGHAAVFQSLGSYQNTGGYFPPPSGGKAR